MVRAMDFFASKSNLPSLRRVFLFFVVVSRLAQNPFPRTQHYTHRHSGFTRTTTSRAGLGGVGWGRGALVIAFGSTRRSSIAASDEAFVEATIPMQQAEHTFTPMRPLRVARKPPSCCLDVLAAACVVLPPPPGLLPRTRSSSSSSLPNTNPHNAHYHCTHTPCCRPSLFYPLLLPLTNSLLSPPRHTSTATSPPLHLSNALTTPPTHPHQHHQHGGPRKNGPARHPFLLAGRRANDRVL